MEQRKNIIIKSISQFISDDDIDLIASIEKDKFKVGKAADVLQLSIEKSPIFLWEHETYFYEKPIYKRISKSYFEAIIREILEIEMKLEMSVVVYHTKAICNHLFSKLSFKSLKPTNELICFKNVSFDINKKKILKHSKDQHVTWALNYDYDPKAKCEKFIKFIDEVLPDTDNQSVLQEYLGLIFIDRKKIKMERILILLGEGANGKSVIYEILQNLIGKTNMAHFQMGDLTKANNREYNVAELKGKLVNYCSDLDYKDFSGGNAKRLISGEPVQGRKIKQEPMLLDPVPLFIANANELPPTTDHTFGFFRRNLIIPFTVLIPSEKQNRMLAIELSEELPGIFNWIMTGRDRLLKNSGYFTESKIITAELERYRIESNSVLSFIFDNEILSKEEEGYKIGDIQSSQFYKFYCEWCKTNGLHPFSNVRFSKTIGKEGFLKIRKQEGSCFTIWERKDITLVDKATVEEEALPF